jgi:hypothetical protein
VKYKTISCEGNNPVSKYYPGAPCMERIKVADNIIKAVCWKCLARQVPAPTEKKQSIGFPRGWKFMSQFVHSDGRVFIKGIENETLHGTLPPTEIKEIEKKDKPKKESLDDKISKKFYEKIKKSKKKSTKNKK